jgi:hypothetical protein
MKFIARIDDISFEFCNFSLFYQESLLLGYDVDIVYDFVVLSVM